MEGSSSAEPTGSMTDAEVQEQEFAVQEQAAKSRKAKNWKRVRASRGVGSPGYPTPYWQQLSLAVAILSKIKNCLA